MEFEAHKFQNAGSGIRDPLRKDAIENAEMPAIHLNLQKSAWCSKFQHFFLTLLF